MTKLIGHSIKFILIGYIIYFGLGFYEIGKPFYLQSFVFCILILIPLAGSYEHIISKMLLILFPQLKKEVEKQKTKSFNEKLQEKINEDKDA